jgi:hypothetical protein
MVAAGGLLLAVCFITIVALALGVAVASWTSSEPTWAPRIARGTAVTVGAALLFVAALHPIGQLLP